MGLIAVVGVLCLVGSFFCSLAEAALYSVSRVRIETLRRHGDRSGEVLAHLRERIDEPIAAILILNTLFNTAGAAWIGALVAIQYGSAAVGLFSALFTATILFVSEILPKSLGFKFANRLAPYLALPLQGIIWILWPVVWLCVRVTGLFGRRARLAAVSKEDIISLARLSEKSGSILSHEARWISNALHLDKIKASDIMTPASVVRRLPETMPLGMVKPEAEHWRFSRLPVCKDDAPDRIVGLVQRREVFNALVGGKRDLTIGQLMAAPIFVPEGLPAYELLNRFIQQRTHLFCVKSARGEFVGIVTLEDVLEAMLGTEIVGEQDPYEDMQKVARQMEQAQMLAGELGQGGGVIEQAVLSPSSPMAGKKIKDLALPKDVLVGTVLRDREVIVPHGDLELKTGDRLTLIGRKEDVAIAKRRLAS